MQTIQVIFFGSHYLEQEITHVLQPHQHEIELVASTNESLFSLLKQSKPQIVLLEDIQGYPNIVDVVQRIRSQYPQIKLLVLAHDIDIAEIRQCINIGVAGYLLVDSCLDGLENAIRLVNSGKLTLASEITLALLSKK